MLLSSQLQKLLSGWFEEVAGTALFLNMGSHLPKQEGPFVDSAQFPEPGKNADYPDDLADGCDHGMTHCNEHPQLLMDYTWTLTQIVDGFGGQAVTLGSF